MQETENGGGTETTPCTRPEHHDSSASIASQTQHEDQFWRPSSRQHSRQRTLPTTDRPLHCRSGTAASRGRNEGKQHLFLKSVTSQNREGKTCKKKKKNLTALASLRLRTTAIMSLKYYALKKKETRLCIHKLCEAALPKIINTCSLQSFTGILLQQKFTQALFLVLVFSFLVTRTAQTHPCTHSSVQYRTVLWKCRKS